MPATVRKLNDGDDGSDCNDVHGDVGSDDDDDGGGQRRWQRRRRRRGAATMGSDGDGDGGQYNIFKQ